jgi:hypothetical protein
MARDARVPHGHALGSSDMPLGVANVRPVLHLSCQWHCCIQCAILRCDQGLF